MTAKKKTTVKSLPPAPVGRAYLAIGPGSWGRSHLATEAIRRARADAYRLRGVTPGIVVFEVPDGAVLDAMGDVLACPGGRRLLREEVTEVYRNQ